MPTAVTAPFEQIAHAHEAIADAIAAAQADLATAQDCAAILGMHLEGPFISPRRLGAHPALNLEPRGDAFERMVAMRALKLITLAPELPGALDAIRRLIARGVVVSIGHTNATLDEADAGIDAGARMFTHLFNAMRPLESSRSRRHRRGAGEIGSAVAAIIPDGCACASRDAATRLRRARQKGLIITYRQSCAGGHRTRCGARSRPRARDDSRRRRASSPTARSPAASSRCSTASA